MKPPRFPVETIQIVPGQVDHDCAIVALSWYLGIPYADVLRVAALEDSARAKHGLSTAAMMRTAFTLGCVLRRRRAMDPMDSYGILIFRNHAVIVRNGLAFQPDGTVWELDVFMVNAGYTLADIECLLVAVGPSRKAVVR